MSPNYVFYAERMLEIQAARRLSRPLHKQLNELFRFVQQCERSWSRPSHQNLSIAETTS
jgi:hypothetical protein